MLIQEPSPIPFLLLLLPSSCPSGSSVGLCDSARCVFARSLDLSLADTAAARLNTFTIIWISFLCRLFSVLSVLGWSWLMSHNFQNQNVSITVRWSAFSSFCRPLWPFEGRILLPAIDLTEFAGGICRINWLYSSAVVCRQKKAFFFGLGSMKLDGTSFPYKKTSKLI